MGEIERDRDWDRLGMRRLLWWSVCDFDFFFLRDLLLTGLLGEEEAEGRGSERGRGSTAELPRLSPASGGGVVDEVGGWGGGGGLGDV